MKISHAGLKPSIFLNKIILTLCSLFFFVVGFAQDTKKVDVDISTDKGGGGYGPIWLWVVGIAVFILLLVALMGRRRRDA